MRVLTLRWNEEHPLTADILGGHDSRRHTFTPGRVCALPGCDTRLSIYNGSDLCAAHDFTAHLRLPVGRRPARSEPHPQPRVLTSRGGQR